MKSHVLVVSGFSAMVALAVIGYGCSSSDNGGGSTGTGGAAAGQGGAAAGQGGTTGGGQGGAAAGQGGMTGGGQGGAAAGQGGMTGGGQGGLTGGGSGGVTGGGSGGMTGGLLACAVAPDDKSPCNSDTACTKTCGINASKAGLPRAMKGCTCSGPAPTGLWACPSSLGACMYPTADWSCLKLPVTPVPCPGSGTAVTTATIVSGTTPCTPTTGTCSGVCGSSVAGTFSYAASGVGKVGYCACIGTVYQCASVNEWAPQ